MSLCVRSLEACGTTLPVAPLAVPPFERQLAPLADHPVADEIGPGEGGLGDAVRALEYHWLRLVSVRLSIGQEPCHGTEMA